MADETELSDLEGVKKRVYPSRGKMKTRRRKKARRDTRPFKDRMKYGKMAHEDAEELRKQMGYSDASKKTDRKRKKKGR